MAGFCAQILPSSVPKRTVQAAPPADCKIVAVSFAAATVTYGSEVAPPAEATARESSSWADWKPRLGRPKRDRPRASARAALASSARRASGGRARRVDLL